MARGKKKGSALTSEEKLAQALLPVEEQPYKVPENWCWTRTGSIAEVASGGTPSSSVAEYYEGGTIPWISPADLSGYNDIYISSGAKNITELGLEKSSAKLLPADTVCLSSRAPIGYVAIAQNPICTNQGFKNFMPSSCYLPKYLYWYLKGNKELLESYASGTTFLELSGSKAAVVEIPLAPLAEQQRIVDRIEYLFAKLDEAKEKAQSVLDSFETRKAAILHKAFTGELTAKWRAEHSASAFSKMEKFGEITSEVRLGLVKGKVDQAYDKQYPYLKMNNITVDGRVDIEDMVCVDASEDEVKMYALHEGDFLFNTRNSFELVGKNTVWNSEKSGVVLFNNNIMRVRFSSEINPRYVSFFFNSSEGKTQLDKCKKNTTNIAAIYAKNLNEIDVPIVHIEEQTEIVRILDSLFAKEQQAREAAEAVLEKIDLLKKSILARAFRGELDTNDPNDEPAVELLKKML